MLRKTKTNPLERTLYDCILFHCPGGIPSWRGLNRTLAFLLILCLLAGSLLLFTGCTVDAVELPPEDSAASGEWGITAAGPVTTGAVAASTDDGNTRSTDVLNSNDAPLVDALISSATISAAMEQYNLSDDSTAVQALRLINSEYSACLDQAQKDGLMVFLFEGAGENQDPAERKDAMCVVVQNGEILYLSTCCSTIPDYPFSPWKNDGSDVPTLCSGIYSFDTVNHNGIYAALRVRDDRVIRFRRRHGVLRRRFQQRKHSGTSPGTGRKLPG